MIGQDKIFVLNMEEVMAIAEARHENPHHILGMHSCLEDVYVNAFIKGVHAVHVVDVKNKKEYPMSMEMTDGFYTVKIPDSELFDYQLKVFVTNWDDDGNEVEDVHVIYDAYRFPYVVDRKKVMDVVMDNVDPADGFMIKDLLGARSTEVDGISGTVFCMNMPGAKRVSVVGDFNHWDGSVNPMKRIDYTNLFELFIPYDLTGSRYKFEALYSDGHIDIFADPYATAYESYPRNASVFADLTYHWKDQKYLENREKKQMDAEPLNIYEIHLPTWKGQQDTELNYADLGKEIAAYVKNMGYNYVELMPLMEYGQEDSWGYATTGVYAPTSRFGTPVDFMAMVDEFHKKDIGVIMDMVSITDVDCMMYWVDTFHLDGIRLDHVDMFYEWKRVTDEQYDSILVLYRWNVDGAYALQDYMSIRPEKRGNIWEFVQDRQAEFGGAAGIIALSHDMVAHGTGSFIEKMPGGYEDKFADLRVLYGLAMTLPGHKLTFMGQEMGIFGGFNGKTPLDWSLLDFDANQYLKEYVKKLNKLYMTEPAFTNAEEADSSFAVMDSKKDQVAGFIRKTKDSADTCYVICNFGLTDVKSYKLSVDSAGSYKEIFSSDLPQFGGEGNNNKSVKKTTSKELEIQLPALSLTIMKKVKA